MTPEDKEQLIHGLKMLAQGRVNFAETVANLIDPEQLTVAEVTESTTEQLIERLDGGTVELEIPDEPQGIDPHQDPAGWLQQQYIRAALLEPEKPKTVGSGSLKAKPGPKPKQKP